MKELLLRISPLIYILTTKYHFLYSVISKKNHLPLWLLSPVIPGNDAPHQKYGYLIISKLRVVSDFRYVRVDSVHYFLSGIFIYKSKHRKMFIAWQLN